VNANDTVREMPFSSFFLAIDGIISLPQHDAGFSVSKIRGQAPVSPADPADGRRSDGLLVVRAAAARHGRCPGYAQIRW